jgi:hypothetical protein
VLKKVACKGVNLKLWNNAMLYTVKQCSYVYKRDEVTGEWRRLHNEELNDLCR